MTHDEMLEMIAEMRMMTFNLQLCRYNERFNLHIEKTLHRLTQYEQIVNFEIKVTANNETVN
jgi:hypothetical protein